MRPYIYMRLFCLKSSGKRIVLLYLYSKKDK